MPFWARGLRGGQASQACPKALTSLWGRPTESMVVVPMGDDYWEGETQRAVGRRCRGSGAVGTIREEAEIAEVCVRSKRLATGGRLG